MSEATIASIGKPRREAVSQLIRVNEAALKEMAKRMRNRCTPISDIEHIAYSIHLTTRAIEMVVQEEPRTPAADEFVGKT